MARSRNVLEIKLDAGRDQVIPSRQPGEHLPLFLNGITGTQQVAKAHFQLAELSEYVYVTVRSRGEGSPRQLPRVEARGWDHSCGG